MANYKSLSADLLNEIFIYKGGNLHWRYDRGSRAKRGDIAGSLTNFGYISVRINKKPYQAHKIIYFMCTGEWPEFLDHINGNRSDNRIENLRPATRSENYWNRAISDRNTSGVKGVCFDRSIGKWYARVTANGKTKRKTFQDIKDAEEWVARIRNEMHGEFASHGRIAS